MDTQFNKSSSIPCYLVLTNYAEDKFKSLFSDQITRHDSLFGFYDLINSQKFYRVYYEKTNGRLDNELNFSIYFDTEVNQPLLELTNNRTLELHCVVKKDCILVTSISLLHLAKGEKNSRRLTRITHFYLAKSQTPIDDELIMELQQLPLFGVQSMAVKKRLKSWGVYLDILNRKAENNEVDLYYHHAYLSEDYQMLHVYCKDLKQIKNLHLRKATAILKYNDDDDGETIGYVDKYDYIDNEIIIELSEDYTNAYKKNIWFPNQSGYINLNNFGELAQINRLKMGLRLLESGKALNPNLENILFDNNPFRDTTANSLEFDMDESFNNNLNIYQKKAVQGAMKAEDIYLIQGPPGTGKTTVIAEICYQNAIRGLKTLVASQSNLAVDNALNKLIFDPKIRIVRKGRTSSIEPEGIRFTEDNIANTWKQQTLHKVDEKIKQMNQQIANKSNEIEDIKNKISDVRNYIKKISKARNRVNPLSTSINLNQKEFEKFKSQLVYAEQIKENVKEQQNIKNNELTELQIIVNNDLEEFKWREEYNKLSAFQTQIINNINYCTITKKITDKTDALISDQQIIKELKIRLTTLNRLYMGFSSHPLDILVEHIKATKVHLPYNLDQLINNYLNRLLKIHSTINLNKEKMDTNDLYMHELSLLIKRQKRLLEIYGDTLNSTDTEMIKKTIGMHDLDITIDAMTYRLDSFKESTNSFLKFIYQFKINNDLDKISKDLNKAVQIQSYLLKENEEFLDKIIEQKNKKKLLEPNKLKITNQLISIAQQQINYIAEEITQKEQNIESLKTKIQNYEEQLSKIPHDQSISSLNELKNQLDNVQNNLKELGEIEKAKSYFYKRLEATEREYKAIHATFLKIEEDIVQRKKTIDQRTQILFKQQKELEEVEHLLSTVKGLSITQIKAKNEIEVIKLKSIIEENKALIESITNEIIFLEHWRISLNEADEQDLINVKKLYIKHANVIGITCVQSASKDFMEEYPDFDVVIIDEVSKATPPELLLPMLKGKKIVLVGDHNQLPPLIGNETLDEVVANINEQEEKNNIKEIIQESLFERLFKSLPSDYKSTLRIQYRMHEHIMNNITQFYEGDVTNDSINLVCGLHDSNKQRDHQLEGKLVQRGQHVLWFDMPNEPKHFEQQEPGSTSFYNPSEIKVIGKLLDDFEAATRKAKLEGRIAPADKKAIGVISFYGEQVRRIKNLINQSNYKHLDCRVGTIDRFQGIEKEVVIASFVRNHKGEKGNIGFSKDYRRLNVALSRAQELMVIVGSAQMFTVNTKNDLTKRMYSNVVNNIRNLKGLRDLSGRYK